MSVREDLFYLTGETRSFTGIPSFSKKPWRNRDTFPTVGYQCGDGCHRLPTSPGVYGSGSGMVPSERRLSSRWQQILEVSLFRDVPIRLRGQPSSILTATLIYSLEVGNFLYFTRKIWTILPNILGDMFQPTTSTNDPIFWNHHSFVDLIWENWRIARQVSCIPSLGQHA